MAAAIALLVGATMSASTAVAAGAVVPGNRAVETVGLGRIVPAGSVATARSGVGCPKLSRVGACEEIPASVTFYHNGSWEGQVNMKITLGWYLQALNSHFDAAMQVKVVGLAGKTAGATAGFTMDCTGTCAANGAIDGPLTDGNVIKGKFGFDDVTRSVHTVLATITMKAVKPGYYGPPATGSGSVKVRCDDRFAGRSAGCVNPAFTPTIDAMTQLPEIAANIRRIQKAGHIGQPGYKLPLHRLWDNAKRDKNRREVCPRKAPPGHAGKSCDEYPFASSYEGGKKLPEPYRGIAWVDPSEQDSQGGLLKGFYGANRMLDKDPFWVEV